MRRILIVEDDKVGRQVLRLFLMPFGEVVVSSRGDEALGAFFGAHHESSPFELIVLDLGLPDQDGINVLRQIRSFENNQRKENPSLVIILTGNTEEEQINKAQQLGASKYLLKPVIESELLAHLEEFGIESIAS